MSIHHSIQRSQHTNLADTDLRLCLSLPPAATLPLQDCAMHSGKGYSRALNNESLLSSIKESHHTQLGNSCVAQQPQQTDGVTSTGKDELFVRRERRPQICGTPDHQMQGSSEKPYDSSIDPNSTSEAVGWPPVQTCRKNIIAAKQRSYAHENETETMKDNCEAESAGRSNFVKVIMDGMAIGRKVDLNAHNSYNTLALSLQNMFQPPINTNTNTNTIVKEERRNSNHWLLEDSWSDYLLTYVDKEGDWMLVGDAPWGMFVKSVKRLRIAKIEK